MIYDYVDIHVPVLERMYHKRLSGYAQIGYKTLAAHNQPDKISMIYDTDMVTSCDNNYKTGTSGLTFSSILLGNKAGRVRISYDTYSAPDRIDIYQGERWIDGTGTDPNSPIPPLCDCNKVRYGDGFVGQNGIFEFNYDPKNRKTITVVVSGCLNGGTAWEWTLVESPECY